MSRYPKYATTVIGAHSVPDWYEALDRLVAVGPALDGGRWPTRNTARARPRCSTRNWPASTSITGGEMHRRTHNRHSPPNAMLNYFWQKIPAFQGSTRPKPITPHDPERLPSGRDLPRRASTTPSTSAWSTNSRRSRR